MCWTSSKTIGYSSKNLGPSQKTLRPSWCLKLVTGLFIIPCGSTNAKVKETDPSNVKQALPGQGVDVLQGISSKSCLSQTFLSASQNLFLVWLPCPQDAEQTDHWDQLDHALQGWMQYDYLFIIFLRMQLAYDTIVILVVTACNLAVRGRRQRRRLPSGTGNILQNGWIVKVKCGKSLLKLCKASKKINSDMANVDIDSIMANLWAMLIGSLEAAHCTPVIAIK